MIQTDGLLFSVKSVIDVAVERSELVALHSTVTVHSHGLENLLVAPETDDNFLSTEEVPTAREILCGSVGER